MKRWLAACAIGAMAMLRITDCAAADAFTHRFVLVLNNHAAYYALAVPPVVYEQSQRADLGDVRVFNGAGEPVPYSLDAPREQAAAPVLRDVKWFSLPPAGGGNDGTPAGVTVGADGALRLVPSASSARAAEQHKTDLVDLGADHARTAALLVHLRNAGYQGRVQADSGDDLRTWRRLGEVSMLKADRGGETLVQDRIPFDAPPGRYLRLRWLDALPAIESMQVQVRADGISAPPYPLHWRNDVATRAGATAGEYLFETDGVYPVERLAFSLPQVNTVAHATVYSRPDTNSPWREVSRGVLFRLVQGTTEQRNAPFRFAPDSDRQWRVVVDMRNGGLGGGTPKVSFGWQPAMLTFVARGTPPFTLAVGNSRLRSAAQARAALVVTLSAAIGTARLGAPLPVSAQEMRTALAGDQPARRPYVLWGALVLAVAVLAAMAWRLMRQR